MKIEEIRTLAQDIGIKPGKLNKTQLVRSIQLQEGNFDCFATAVNKTCDQQACLWLKDCFAAATKKPAAAKKSAAKAKTATAKKAKTEKKPEASKTSSKKSRAKYAS